jgi:hypothetical protein
LEKCFNRDLERSTRDRFAFHAPETGQKPVFSRSDLADAQRAAKICMLTHP